MSRNSDKASDKHSSDNVLVTKSKVQVIRDQNLKRIDELLASKQVKVDGLFDIQNNGRSLSKTELDQLISLKCELLILKNDRLEYLNPVDQDDYPVTIKRRGGKRRRDKQERKLARQESCNRAPSPVRSAAIDAFCANRSQSQHCDSRSSDGGSLSAAMNQNQQFQYGNANNCSQQQYYNQKGPAVNNVGLALKTITNKDMMEMKCRESLSDFKPKEQRPAYRLINMSEQLTLSTADEWALPRVQLECKCDAELANRYWPDDKDEWYDGECHREYIVERQAWYQFEQSNYAPHQYELFRLQRQKLHEACERKGNLYFKKLRTQKLKEYSMNSKMQQQESKESFANRVYSLNRVLHRSPTVCKCFAKPDQPWFDVECEAVTVADIFAQQRYRQQSTEEFDDEWKSKRELFHKVLKHKQTGWERRVARLALHDTLKSHPLHQLPKIIARLPSVDVPSSTATLPPTTGYKLAPTKLAVNTNTVTGSATDEPWYDDECITAKQHTDSALLRFSEDASEANRLHYVENKKKMEFLLAKKSLQRTQDNPTTDGKFPEWYDKECKYAVDVMITAKNAYDTDSNSDNMMVYQIRKKQKDKILHDKRCAWEVQIKQQNHSNQNVGSMSKKSRWGDMDLPHSSGCAADSDLYNPFEEDSNWQANKQQQIVNNTDGASINSRPTRCFDGSVMVQAAAANLRSPKDKNVFAPKRQRPELATNSIAASVDLTENSDNSNDGMSSSAGRDSNVTKSKPVVNYRPQSFDKIAATSQPKFDSRSTGQSIAKSSRPTVNYRQQSFHKVAVTSQPKFVSKNTGPSNRDPSKSWSNYGNNSGQQQPAYRGQNQGSSNFANNTGQWSMNRPSNVNLNYTGQYPANHGPIHGYGNSNAGNNNFGYNSEQHLHQINSLGNGGPNQGFSNFGYNNGTHSNRQNPNFGNNTGQHPNREFSNFGNNPNFGNNNFGQPNQQRFSWNAPGYMRR